MMARHGTIQAFDSATEDWTAYSERLEQYFVANDIAEGAKKRAILLSGCGASTYKLIRSLVVPDKPTDKSYADLVSLLQNHFNPAPAITVQRFKFNSRSRQNGENVATFVSELRHLAMRCDFGAALEEMLRDRLVCGIKDEHIQRRLLAEPNLTFKKAQEIAQALETADRNTADLQQQQQQVQAAVPVHAVQKNRKPKTIRDPSASKDAKPVKGIPTCYRCGGKHLAPDCWHKETECYTRGKKGHISRVCRSKGKTRGNPKSPKDQKAKVVEAEEESFVVNMAKTGGQKVDPFMLTVLVDGKSLEMEVDTGASISLISERTLKTHWTKKDKPPALMRSAVKLSSYTGEAIKVLGVINVTAGYQDRKEHLKLIVVAGDGSSLLGQDWLKSLQIKWDRLYKVKGTSELTLKKVLYRHSLLFKDELGTIKGVTAKIYMDPATHPQFFKPRPLPLALKARAGKELERLQKENVISPVQFSDWAAPVVPVIKGNGSVRICGDFKVTVNKYAKVEEYPLPLVDDLFASLSGGQCFTKLDLPNAYLQLMVEEKSKEYLTINTHKGLFRYNCLPFGVASAPAIFQCTMESLLQGLKQVAVYIDDILITGQSEADHLRTLEEVLGRLEAACMRLKAAKMFIHAKGG